jgi:hypothetical protein
MFLGLRLLASQWPVHDTVTSPYHSIPANFFTELFQKKTLDDTFIYRGRRLGEMIQNNDGNLG